MTAKEMGGDKYKIYDQGGGGNNRLPMTVGFYRIK